MSDEKKVIPNLISKLNDENDIFPPIQILKQQALNLELEANNSINSFVEVEQSYHQQGAYFNYSFFISSKTNNFRYQLFNASHEK